jgi:ribosomal-protein-alanine N-acetyltransferase
MRQHVTTIAGDGVLLRPVRESDLEESVRVWTPELRHMYGGSLTAPAGPIEERREGKLRWLERVRRGEEGHCFAIETDGRYIGTAFLRASDEANQRGRYRIGIENPEYWGKGYGTEVTRLMLQYAFETLGLHRVDLRVAAYNTRAIRCYEKCGFQVEGVERDSFFVDGEWHDDWLMAVLKDEWERQASGEAGPADEVRIRSYTTSDYDAVFALWQAVGFAPDHRDSREALQHKLCYDRGPFLVAEQEDRVVGSAVASWDGRRAWVYRVAVTPTLQGRGIGRRLMTEVETRLRHVGAMSAALLINRRNELSIRFYQRLGYEAEEQVGFMMKMLDAGEERSDGH